MYDKPSQSRQGGRRPAKAVKPGDLTDPASVPDEGTCLLYTSTAEALMEALSDAQQMLRCQAYSKSNDDIIAEVCDKLFPGNLSLIHISGQSDMSSNV